MGIGASLFLIALGAILAFAVNATVAGLSIATIGVILIVVGVVGLLLTLLLAERLRRGDRLADDRVVVREREVV